MREGPEGAGGEKGRKRVCGEWKQKSRRTRQGRPKALPAKQNASQKFSGWRKIKEVGLGTKFKIGKLILSKKIKLLLPDVIF